MTVKGPGRPQVTCLGGEEMDGSGLAARQRIAVAAAGCFLGVSSVPRCLASLHRSAVCQSTEHQEQVAKEAPEVPYLTLAEYRADGRPWAWKDQLPDLGDRHQNQDGQPLMCCSQPTRNFGAYGVNGTT